jgi:large subunit ribosomal protein L30
MSKIAAVRIRGEVCLAEPKKRTLRFLNLARKHNCVLLENKPETVGMLRKVSDCITWGPVSEETIKKMQDKRKPKKGKIYALSPPAKGFERKGIKVPYSIGGALGERKEIDSLILRMI